MTFNPSLDGKLNRSSPDVVRVGKSISIVVSGLTMINPSVLVNGSSYSALLDVIVPGLATVQEIRHKGSHKRS